MRKMDNAERTDARAFMADAWQTAQDERIGERILELVSKTMTSGQRDAANNVLETLRNAAAPTPCEGLSHLAEVLFTQQMEGPFNKMLLAWRLSEQDAKGFEEGLLNFLRLADERAGDKLSLKTEAFEGASLTTLVLPKQAPFSPCVARHGDVVLVSSHADLVRAAIQNAKASPADGFWQRDKISQAVSALPQAEDALVAFDGRMLFTKLRGIGDFIEAQSNNAPQAKRAANIMRRIIDEFAILDCEVSVEYTDGKRNCLESYGTLQPESHETLLYKTLATAKPCDDWAKWTPADATSFSVHNGINLATFYQGALQLALEVAPEIQPKLDQWSKMQDDVDVHVVKILQAFDGPSATAAFPVVDAQGNSQTASVTAIRCSDPEQIEALILRAFEGLERIPAVQAQGISLTDCPSLEGFHQINAMALAMTPTRPTFGFRDGWLWCSGNPAAIQKALDVRAGDEPALDAAKFLERFGVELKGPVYSIGYSHPGATVRAIADAIDQAAATAPMMIGIAAAQAPPETAELLQEAVGLLPSLA
ncbi:MAG: hypothetical protein KDA61_21955, partial [Planctomycetales bacterium]|nr:hypothetical protein [Planctomycetales bacterium]